MSYWDGTQWVAEAAPQPKAPSRKKRLAAAALEASLIVALAFGLIAGAAFAGKGGNGGGKGKPGGGVVGGGTISGPVLVDDQNGNGSLNVGDFIRFNVSTAASQPYVGLYCYQDGVLVAAGSEGYFAGALDDGTFGLYSPAWLSGAANCTAYLDVWNGRSMTHLASVSFHVDA